MSLGHSAMEGRCQCGQIQFKTPLPEPIALYICHCTECRHQTSSAYGMTAVFPYFDIHEFAAHANSIGMYSRPNSTGKTEGYFCTNCGSRLVHVFVKMSNGEGRVAKMLSVKAGCLEGLSKDMMRKAFHIWTKSAVVDIPEGVEQYEENPPDSSFAEK